MAVNFSAGFNLDIGDLQSGLKKANELIKESQSAYRKAAAEMKTASASADTYEDAQAALIKQISLQKDVLRNLQKEYERLESEGVDPASSEMVEFRTNINKASEELTRSETQLVKVKAQYKKFRDEAKKAADGVEDVGDAAKDAGDAADDAADDVGVFDIALGNVVANGVSAFVGGVKNAIGALLGLAEETKEYRTELAKMDAAADTAGASAEYIKDKWHDLGAVLGDEGAVGEGLNNLMAAGFTTQEQMDAITKHLEGAAIKWKDTLKFEGLADGLQETLATGAAVGSFGELLERSGVNLETFDEGLAKCTTDAEKQNYVLDQLSKLGLAEVSDAYREQNKELIESNKAQSEYNDTQAELGEKMQPISTAIKQGITDIINAFLELTGNVDFNGIADGISNAFSWFIDTGIPAVIDGVEWIRDNIPTIATVLGGLTAATAAFKIATIAATAAQEGMTLAQYAGAAAQKLLNSTMLANPISLIIMGITALVAAFVYLWNNCEGFRNFWINLWEKVKEITAKAVEGVKNIFGKIVEFVKGNWQSLLLLIVNPFAGAFKLLWDNCDAFREFWLNLWEKIKTVAGDAWRAISEFFVGVANWFDVNVIQPIAQFFVDLWQGIVSAYHTVIDPWIEIVRRAAEIIYNEVVLPIKNYFVQLWSDIKNVFAAVSTWWQENVVSPVVNFCITLWQTVSDIFKNLWGDITALFGRVSVWWQENVSAPIKKAIVSAFEATKDAAAGAWAKIKEIFGNVAGFFKEKFTAAWTAVKNIFSTGGKIFMGIVDGISSAFKKIVNSIIRGINKVVSIPFNAINTALDKLRSTEILGVKPFDWMPTISVPEIPELAKGGIVRGATQAIIGEAGKEAVLPLERNTEWMDMLAERLAAKGGGVTVNQTNHFAKAHTRYEMYQSRKQLAAAVRLART